MGADNNKMCRGIRQGAKAAGVLAGLMICLLAWQGAALARDLDDDPDYGLELARQVIELSGLKNAIRHQMWETAKAVDKASGGRYIKNLNFKLTAEQIKIFIETVADTNWQFKKEAIVAGLAQAYAKFYSLDELKGMIAFYQSELGQKINMLTMILAQETSDIMKAADKKFERKIKASDSFRAEFLAELYRNMPIDIRMKFKKE